MILIKPTLSLSDSSTDIEAQDKSQLVQTLCEDSRKPSQPLFDKSFFFGISVGHYLIRVC